MCNAVGRGQFLLCDGVAADVGMMMMMMMGGCKAETGLSERIGQRKKQNSGRRWRYLNAKKMSMQI